MSVGSGTKQSVVSNRGTRRSVVGDSLLNVDVKRQIAKEPLTEEQYIEEISVFLTK
eukprot:Awhi_evm1s13832